MQMVPLSQSGLRHRRVAVHHGRAAAVLSRPVVPHGQAEVVGLAGGFAVETELAHLARTASLHGFLQPGVGHHQFAVVKHVVTDEGIDELPHLLDELE
jgi:hypothetical protein